MSIIIIFIATPQKTDFNQKLYLLWQLAKATISFKISKDFVPSNWKAVKEHFWGSGSPVRCILSVILYVAYIVLTLVDASHTPKKS